MVVLERKRVGAGEIGAYVEDGHYDPQAGHGSNTDPCEDVAEERTFGV